MKKTLTVIGIALSILIIVLSVLFLLQVQGIQLGYCMISMVACLVVFALGGLAGGRTE